MELRYFVPFKAQSGVDAQFALQQRLLNIEGIAIDTSMNANRWCVPDEDLDFFVQSLQNAQLRVDHAESAMAVIGKVMTASRQGSQVIFTAEVGDLPMIERILRNYVSHVSAQVDSDNVECSKCRQQTRKDGVLVHLCPGAYEIVHKPKVRELSIVASPAYTNTIFKPVGFAAAMDGSQLTLPNNLRTASDYDDFERKLMQLGDQIRSLPSNNNVDDLLKKIESLEAEIAKRAGLRNMYRKISNLQKQLAELKEAEADDAAEAAGVLYMRELFKAGQKRD